MAARCFTGTSGLIRTPRGAPSDDAACGEAAFLGLILDSSRPPPARSSTAWRLHVQLEEAEADAVAASGQRRPLTAGARTIVIVRTKYIRPALRRR